jgi:hypothetical protein
MGIMAIAAGHQTFVDAVVKRLGEVRLHFQVAGVTERELRLFQHGFFDYGLVDGMAVEATDVVLPVRGAKEIALFFAVGVTSEPARIGFPLRHALKGEYLGFVAAAFHVGLAGAVAGFAAMPLRSSLGVQRGGKMPRALVLLEFVFVAGFAGF